MLLVVASMVKACIFPWLVRCSEDDDDYDDDDDVDKREVHSFAHQAARRE